MISLLRWLGISFLPAVAGIAFPAPDYYRALRRPAWAPPPWLFGPAWTLLYALMGVAAWLVAGAAMTREAHCASSACSWRSTRRGPRSSSACAAPAWQWPRSR
jgi:tryptophan-rich sensory protein